jgi:steroid delta-isomerase-like uncharacterized protein
MSTELGTDIKTLVQDWTECYNRHDPDGVASYMSEDCVFINVGNGQRLEGRAAMREDAVTLFGMWSELRIDIVDMIVTADRYVKQWVMTGVHTGDVPGLPATDKPFRIRGCGVGEVRDGKIVEVTEYWNMAEFLIQVGILPPPGA